MGRNDWGRVEELFHAALQLSAAERRDYLDSACSGDETLRREVESLVSTYEREQSFIERPALSLGMKVLGDAAPESLAGKSIGHYRVERMLGRGGMGEVYLAEDSRLERDVALKFLANRLFDDEWAREQLTKEARAAASLEHPNICAVYGIEETEGYNFIVMPYVEGETLASLTRRGPLETERALDLAEQIAGALAAAHARGVVHRDIKPQNVVVTAEGKAKVLDFGLAKLVRRKQEIAGALADTGQTLSSGLVVGTIAYMSPEQVRAEEVDHRGDIFSFGIVLYQMLGGANPFRREAADDILTAIKEHDPPPLTNLPTVVRDGLNRVLRRCLEKEREGRYQTADELLGDLRRLRAEYERFKARRAGLAASLRTRGGRAAAALVALVLMLAAAAAAVYLRRPASRTLAVLPFVNESADPATDYLSEGLTQNLTRRLSDLSGLRVKPTRLVSVYKEPGTDPLRAARELGVEAVLVGKIFKRDEALYLQAALVRASDGARLWEETFDVKMAEVLTLQDEITRDVATGLRLSLAGEEGRRLLRRPTDNPEALRLYMLGQYYWTRRDSNNIRTAIDLFERAVELDPLFAPAHAALADSYVFLPTVAFGPERTSDMIDKARASAKRALEIDNLLCEAHTSLGVIMMRHDWDWQGAEAEFRTAIELRPDYAPAHFWYSQLLMVTGRSDEALRESEANRTHDPFSPPAALNVARAHYFARRYDAAVEVCREVLAKNPESESALYVSGLSYFHDGMRREGLEALERLYAKNPLYAAAPLGYVYAKTGREADALRVLNSLEEHSKGRPVPAQEKAIIHIGLGDKDRAFAYLEDAYRERFSSLISLKVEPLFDDLRADPRYSDLARRMNLAP